MTDTSSRLIEQLLSIYPTTRRFHDVLIYLLRACRDTIEAESAALFLEDQQVLTGAHAAQGAPTAEWATEYVLVAGEGGWSGLPLPSRMVFPDGLLAIAEEITTSVYLSRVVGGDTLGSLGSDLIVLDSRKVALCRGVFLFQAARQDAMAGRIREACLLIEASLPILEAVFAREAGEATTALLAGGPIVPSRASRERFRATFTYARSVVGAEGASLMVFGLATGHTAELHLVATDPRRLPSSGPPYGLAGPSVTGWVMSLARSCAISDSESFRQQLFGAWGKAYSEPVWRDIEDPAVPRSLMFCFHQTAEGPLYILRCANSTRNPTRHFSVLDRLLGERLVVTLALMHRSMENEARALRLFSDVKHELKIKLQAIRSAGRFVAKALSAEQVGQGLRRSEDERIKKLENLDLTVEEIRRLLRRFSFAVTANPDVPAKRMPFRPYADLVRPACSMLESAAKKRGIRFAFHYTTQLGLMYSDKQLWSQVVQNVVDNAVKYTLDGETIAVAFERVSAGGGWIHVASKSIPIIADEAELIFGAGHRGQHAKNVAPGEGLGLTIAAQIAGDFGGTVKLRIGEVNVFSILLPGPLFRPPAAETGRDQ